MKITITRSAQFRNVQAVATGQTIYRTAEITVNPSDLSVNCRAALIGIADEPGAYPEHLRCIGYSRDFDIGINYGKFCYGSIDIEVDSLSPSPGEVSDAILTAIDVVKEKKAKKEAEELAKEVKESRIAELKRELDELTKS